MPATDGAVSGTSPRCCLRAPACRQGSGGSEERTLGAVGHNFKDFWPRSVTPFTDSYLRQGSALAVTYTELYGFFKHALSSENLQQVSARSIDAVQYACPGRAKNGCRSANRFGRYGTQWLFTGGSVAISTR